MQPVGEKRRKKKNRSGGGGKSWTQFFALPLCLVGLVEVRYFIFRYIPPNHRHKQLLMRMDIIKDIHYFLSRFELGNSISRDGSDGLI